MPKRIKNKQVQPSSEAIIEAIPQGGFIERHIVIGDLHLKRTDPLGVIESDGLNTRLKDKLAALRQAITFALENGATHVDILGDIFDAVNPTENLKRLLWTELQPVLKAKLKVTILIGNHDSTGEFFNFAGDALIARDNIRIVNKHAYTYEACPGINVMYMPFIHREKLIGQFIDLCTADKKPAILFGHFEIEGAELAPDNVIMREGIDRTLFDGVEYVWLGHIHKFQEFRPGMAYIGSSVKCDFGEISNRKIFGVLDITTDPDNMFQHRYIEIIQRSMQQVVIAENDPDNLYMETTPPENLTQPGILLKFVFQGTKEWLDSLDKQRFKRRFPQATRVVMENQVWDSDRKPTELVTTNMVDRVHALVTAKNKGKEYLEVGLLLAKQAQEIDL